MTFLWTVHSYRRRSDLGKIFATGRERDGHRLLCRVRVFAARKHMETLQEPRPKAVGRQHPLHRMLHHPHRTFGKCRTQRRVTEISRIPRVAHIFLPMKLPLRNADIRHIDDDHLVAAKALRRKGRSMFAAENHRGPRRNPPQRLSLGINENPQRSLCWRRCLHVFSVGLGRRREISTSDAPSPRRAPRGTMRVSPPALPQSVSR